VLVVLFASGLIIPTTLPTTHTPQDPTLAADRDEATLPAPDAAQEVRETYGRIPLSFEANQGQTAAAVDFLARGAGYTLFLQPTEAVFVLSRQKQGASSKSPSGDTMLARHASDASRASGSRASETLNAQPESVLRVKLVGADASARVAGAEELAGKVNYIKGTDAAGWRTNIPTFGRVRYSEVYPGIDVVYYGNQRQLEYDFHVAAGRDARAVKLEFKGADSVRVDERGDLLLALGEDVVRQPKPFVYQEVAGVRRAVEGGYTVEENGLVSFALGDYDARLPLVIDPVIIYSTYLGGSGGEQGLAVAIDPSGNAYIAGFTNGTNFPTANAVQATNGGFQDAFVTKFNAAGTALIYSTYLGGTAVEQARGLAVDSAGNAYVVGHTNSTNFPIANALKSVKGSNGEDAFVTKLNPTGSALVYSTFLGGGDSAEFAEAVTVDAAGNAYVTGSTFSNDFPTVNPIQATYGGGSTDAYLSKINAAGNALVYSTYLGGSGNEDGRGVAVDSAGNAYLTGFTGSTNFPTLSPIQATYGGGIEDTYALKVNAAGNALVYSTYLGGSEQDRGEGIAVDSAGNAYISGQTFSTNFPVANAIQPVNGGTTITQDATVTKLNAAGNAFFYSTYLGGLGGEIAFAIAVDAAGNAYIAGASASNNTFPTANAIQCTRAGGADVIITKLNAAGNAFFYSTYLGGSDSDEARGIALDSSGNAYVGGFTHSSNWPVVNAFQSTFGGDDSFGDAFMMKIADASTTPASSLQFGQATYNVNEDVTSINVTVTRTGDTSNAVTVDYATADGTASERSDYTTALGTLRFAAGETSKTVALLISEDSHTEGAESFTLVLSNPTGGGSIGCTAGTATIQIADDASEPATNAIDNTAVFVGQHYHDFLNRQSDAAGQAFWENEINVCGTNAACIDDRRQNVSAAFFLSIEFQQTGYLVFRIYKETFTDSPQRPRGMPRYREFLRDTQEISRGVIVGVGNWEAQLETNKQEFARRWVQSAEFVAQFTLTMTAEQFVDKLFSNAETTPTAAERNAAIAAYGAGGTEGRANALRSVADSASVYNRQYNAAFVLMQYIGYMRRNPNDAPDTSYAGYDFWLAKLNQFSIAGEDVRNETVARARIRRAQMVRAFLVSGEYRGRFGQ
jgi:hypothetical protein